MFSRRTGWSIFELYNKNHAESKTNAMFFGSVFTLRVFRLGHCAAFSLARGRLR